MAAPLNAKARAKNQADVAKHIPNSLAVPYSPEIVQIICARVANGRSLKSVLEDDEPRMPHAVTFLRWLNDPERGEETRRSYALAREALAEHMAGQILEIADDGRNDWMRKNGADDQGWVQNGETVMRSRLRVDAMKWTLSKMFPRKYGDSLQIEQEVTHRAVVSNTPLSPAEWAKKYGGEVIEAKANKQLGAIGVAYTKKTGDEPG